MKKIILIVKREYLTRVKKKSFLVVTFLVPVLIMLLMAGTVYLGVTQGMGDQKKVEVVDESGWFVNKLQNTKHMSYAYTTNYAEAKKTFLDKDFDYLLYIPASMKGITLLGEKTPGIMNTGNIEDDITKVAQSRRLKEAHIDSAVLATAQEELHVEPKQMGEGGEKEAHVVAATGVGFAAAFLIYLALFLYGAQVMRGVIEEKVSRIVEVVISSVKPFQLMMGKIIGVGMVGLTQFVLWIALTTLLSTTVGGALMSKRVAAVQQVTQQANVQAAAKVTQAPEGEVASFLQQVESLPILTIVGCFLFYFLFGYLLYSALFAAVGSAVDNETETQQFMLPLTLPLIFTMMVAQSAILNNPDSPLAVWLSLIPFTSPIAMMIRIPFHVPAWQIACSMLLMIGGFLLTTWVAGRIYRVGILMYGKKASYKELVKWFRYKD